MGLDINSVQMLLAARQQGVPFGQVLMLGRLSLNVYPAKMAALLRKHGLPAEVFIKAGPECAFAEPLFHALGASKAAALDASDFEGAEFVHDLNRPIPEDLKARFDAVVDGGTLEHVFNFPTALQNAMELVKPGGRLFVHTCANNLCGHGFYQFSPELFYRTLSPDNGFEVERMILHRLGPYGRWYEVADPNAIRSRVELISFTPIQLMVQARRARVVPVFSRMPLQSDYVTLWTASQASASGATPSAAPQTAGGKLSRILPGLARLLHVMGMGLEFYQRQSLRNRKFFRPVSRP